MGFTASAYRKIFSRVLLLCMAASGCHNTCVSGFWNGSTGGLRVSNISCTLTKANGAVVVQMSTASATPAASVPFSSSPASLGNVKHLFVTVRGIEAHPDMNADEDSPGWQELAPDLVARPIQLDLLAPSADPQSLGSLTDAKVPAIVPAEEYRQLRFRFLPFPPLPEEVIPERNACGNSGWNCIVFADGAAQPLVFDGVAEELHFTSERSTESLFRVLPDAATHLSFEFDPSASLAFPADGGVRLVPVFRIHSRLPFPAASEP